MDAGKLSEILKKTKEKIERENEVFIRALNQRIENEKKFRSAINCILKHTESTVKVLSLHEQLESNQCDPQTIVKAKKDLKYVADLRMKLEIEVNLSRKRMERLEKSSYDFDPECIESSRVIEIPDSPPKPFEDIDRAKAKVTQKMIVAPTVRTPRTVSSQGQMLEQAAKMSEGRDESSPNKFSRFTPLVFDLE